MALYLFLVVISTTAAFVAAYRTAQWQMASGRCSVDTAVGIYLIVFLVGLVLVGAFVATGAQVTDSNRVGFGLVIQALMITGLLPGGIFWLKKVGNSA